MSKATIVIEGFVAQDPRTGQHDGGDWVSFSVPHTPRRKNRDSGEWEDAGPTLWVQVTLWRDDALRCIDHLAKGGAGSRGGRAGAVGPGEGWADVHEPRGEVPAGVGDPAEGSPGRPRARLAAVRGGGVWR